MFMLRPKLASKSGESWRLCILLVTKSARTKLTLASYFLTGPPILRRLAECELDIQIVRDRFGPSSSVEDAKAGTNEHASHQAWVNPGTSTNAAQLIVEHAMAGKSSVAVGGGLLLVGGKTVLLTTHHPFQLDADTEEGYSQENAAPLVSKLTYAVDGAISFYHEDIEDNVIRPGCADAALDSLTSSTNGHKVTEPFLEVSAPSSNLHWSRKHILGLWQDRATRARNKQDYKVANPMTRGGLNSCKIQVQRDKVIDRSGRIPARVVYTGASLDWSALEFLPKYDNGTPLLRRLNQIGGRTIDTILDTKVHTSLDVTFGTADGEISGRLLLDNVFLHVAGRHLELQTVRLDRPLQRGTSGSWVTHCNQFCGMVIAISDDLPEAYILRADQLTNDMERACGGKIMLPTMLKSPQANLTPSLLPTTPRSPLLDEEITCPKPDVPLLDSGMYIQRLLCAPHLARESQTKEEHTQNDAALLRTQSSLDDSSIRVLIADDGSATAGVNFSNSAEPLVSCRSKEKWQSWLGSSYNGVFWLNGMAGSGKTTLMKHIVERYRPTPSLWQLLESSHFWCLPRIDMSITVPVSWEYSQVPQSPHWQILSDVLDETQSQIFSFIEALSWHHHSDSLGHNDPSGSTLRIYHCATRHHDSKPQDILVFCPPTKPERFKLADFSVSMVKAYDPVKVDHDRDEFRRSQDLWSTQSVVSEFNSRLPVKNISPIDMLLRNDAFCESLMHLLRKHLTERVERMDRWIKYLTKPMHAEVPTDFISIMTHSYSNERPPIAGQSLIQSQKSPGRKSLPELPQKFTPFDDSQCETTATFLLPLANRTASIRPLSQYSVWTHRKWPPSAHDLLLPEKRYMNRESSKLRRLKSRIKRMCQNVKPNIKSS